MQGWSWMAALTLAAALAAFNGPTALAGQPTPIKQTVKLSLRLDGIAREGAEVIIKPGHPACKFKPITEAVKGNGMILLPPIEVETVSADRDCTFAITLKEPGQPDKVVRRNLRIVPTPEGKPDAPQVLTCFVSSNALKDRVAGKMEDAKQKK